MNEIDQVRILIGQGMTRRQVADRMGIKIRRVSYLMQKGDIVSAHYFPPRQTPKPRRKGTPSTPMTPDLVAQIRELAAMGLTKSKIAVELEISRNRVNYAFVQHNIKSVLRGRPRKQADPWDWPTPEESPAR